MSRPRKRKYLEYLSPSNDDQEPHQLVQIPRTSDWRARKAEQQCYDEGIPAPVDNVEIVEANDGNVVADFENDVRDELQDSEQEDENNSSVSGVETPSDQDAQWSTSNSPTQSENLVNVIVEEEANPGNLETSFGSEADSGDDDSIAEWSGADSEGSISRSGSWLLPAGSEHGTLSDESAHMNESTEDSETNNNFLSDSPDSIHQNVVNPFPSLNPAASPHGRRDENDPAGLPQDNIQDASTNQVVALLQPSNAFRKLKTLVSGQYSEIITSIPVISTASLLLNSLTTINHYKLNHTQAEGVMMLINSIFKKNILPPSRYAMDQLFKSSAGAFYHFLCSKCYHYFGQKNHEFEKTVLCDVCQSANTISDLNSALFFVIFDIPTQLELLLNSKGIKENLMNPFNLKREDPTAPLKDVHDGKIYQKFITSLTPDEARVVSFVFSCDGTPLFKTNSVEIWPLFLSLLELPPETRQHRLLLGGIWFGKVKPIQDVFLKAFILHMNDLSHIGFQINVCNELWKMKAFLLGCCADAPARAAIQFVHQHNGVCGCNWCLHPGTQVGPGQRKYFLLDNIPDHRSKEELLRDGEIAIGKLGRNKHENGVTGLSPLLLSNSLDPVDGMVLDMMHHFDHGIGKQVPGSWLGDHGASVSHYIGSPINIERMNSLISSIRLPIEARRPARKLSEFAEYQARDHQNFSLFLSIPILLELNIDSFKPFLKHWMLFVQAAHLLLQQEVTQEDVNTAHILLSTFVVKFEEVYGKECGQEHMSYTTHITLHAAENVSRWGPSWAINAYCFEAGNKSLKSVISSGRGIASQVCRALSQDCAILILETSSSTPDTEMFKRRLTKMHVDRCIYIGNDRYLGAQKTFHPTPDETWLCQQMEANFNDFVVVDKLIHLSWVYSPSKPSLRTDNSIAFLRDGSYVRLNKIIASESANQGYLFVNIVHSTPFMCPARVSPDRAFLRKIDFIEDALTVITPSELVKVCARIIVPSSAFIIQVPNIHTSC